MGAVVGVDLQPECLPHRPSLSSRWQSLQRERMMDGVRRGRRPSLHAPLHPRGEAPNPHLVVRDGFRLRLHLEGE